MNSLKQQQYQFNTSLAVNSNQFSPNRTVNNKTTQQYTNNTTFSSSESNLTYSSQNLSGNGLEQSQQSYINKNGL